MTNLIRKYFFSNKRAICLTEKPRVLFIGPTPPPYSGPEISMKNLLGSSLRQRFDISYLNTNVRKSNATKGNIDIIILLAFFSFVARLVWQLITKRPALVYHFVTATRLGWLGRDVWCIFLSRIFGARIIIHMRAGHFKHNYHECGRLTKGIIHNACSLVTRGFVQSQSLRNQFEGLIQDNRIEVIHNSIDCHKYSPSDPTNYNKNMILFLGHLSYAKGYCDLLKIIPDVVNEHPEVVFHFAGTKIKKGTNVMHNQVTGERLLYDDPDACFDNIIKGRYDKNYIYHGIADEDLKLELLNECNFLVLPSYSEGFSMAVLEALSMGKPVVTTPVGALTDVVVHGVNGLLNRPGDLMSLKDNICCLLSGQRLRDQIAQTNFQYVRKHFSIEKISNQIGDCFLEAIKD